MCDSRIRTLANQIMADVAKQYHLGSPNDPRVRPSAEIKHINNFWYEMIGELMQLFIDNFYQEFLHNPTLKNMFWQIIYALSGEIYHTGNCMCRSASAYLACIEKGLTQITSFMQILDLKDNDTRHCFVKVEDKDNDQWYNIDTWLNPTLISHKNTGFPPLRELYPYISLSRVLDCRVVPLNNVPRELSANEWKRVSEMLVDIKARITEEKVKEVLINSKRDSVDAKAELKLIQQHLQAKADWCRRHAVNAKLTSLAGAPMTFKTPAPPATHVASFTRPPLAKTN